ncbi:hypothetical protein ACFV1W_14745 [Kitasatospora sp. NPDC059648]|uniref:hypothetical protein n=1 Tax=Kitasatospora sp. NPDC059648 TaxID=3346894 RepID=UPI0036A8693D
MRGLRVLRDEAGLPLPSARELLEELRQFGLAGTAVEMARWQVRLGERGVATEVATGFGRAYRYVGPPEPRELAADGSRGGLSGRAVRSDRGGRVGQPVRRAGEFIAWAAERTAAELVEPFTFVIDLGGALRLVDEGRCLPLGRSAGADETRRGGVGSAR